MIYYVNFPLWVCSSFCNEQLCVQCSSATGRKIVWIFPLFCLAEILPNRTLNLINQWVPYALTHKLWLVLLELVIQMPYIITEYFFCHCELLTNVTFIKYNIHVCHVFSWIMHLINFHGQWNMISLNKKEIV